MICILKGSVMKFHDFIILDFWSLLLGLEWFSVEGRKQVRICLDLALLRSVIGWQNSRKFLN